MVIVCTANTVRADTCHHQIGGPDVASEETIETSVIVEVGGEGEWEERPAATASPLVTDHCYTFKRGIKPKDLDKAKAKAAMLGEGGTQQQQYTYILPKNPTTQVTNVVIMGSNFSCFPTDYIPQPCNLRLEF